MSARHLADADDQTPEITVLSGTPTPVELAGVSAVIAGLAQELADDELHAAATGQSAWQRSQRPIRTPLTRGHGAWRGFSG